MEQHLNCYISCEASSTLQTMSLKLVSGKGHTVIKMYNMRMCLISIKSQLKGELSLDKNEFLKNLLQLQ